MSGLAWPELMRLGLVHLRLSVREFWDLTPVELMFLANGGAAASDRLDRSGLAALMVRYPDTSRKETGDDADRG